MTSNISPILSIGMPVYNSINTISRAIDSIKKQSFSEFEIIVSDNCSDDGTYEFLQRMALTDHRIKLFRQLNNIGSTKNFEFVLFNSTSKYFMWAAADDYWLPGFVQENILFLESNSDYVSSISSVQIEGMANLTQFETGTYPLRDSYEINIKTFVLNPAANSRFYSVHKLNSLRAAWSTETQWAHDWVVICNLLKYGKFNSSPNVLMHRGNNGASRNIYKSISESQDLSNIDKIFPFYRFAKFVMEFEFLRTNKMIIKKLITLNLIYTFKMFFGLFKSLLRRS